MGFAFCKKIPESRRKKPGSDLLSHPLAEAVPSALEGLTTVFGMGTGVSPPVQPPGRNNIC